MELFAFQRGFGSSGYALGGVPVYRLRFSARGRLKILPPRVQP
jgi:hypothetical protein